MNSNVKDLLKMIKVVTGITINMKSVSVDKEGYLETGERYLYNMVKIASDNFALAVVRCGCGECNNIFELHLMYHHDDAQRMATKIKEMIDIAVEGFDIDVTIEQV